MPIHSGKDNQGTFYQWGKTGKKYYYESSNEESRKRAYKKAEQQQTAIYSSGYKGDSEMKKPTMKLVNVIVKRKDSKPIKKGDADSMANYPDRVNLDGYIFSLEWYNGPIYRTKSKIASYIKYDITKKNIEMHGSYKGDLETSFGFTINSMQEFLTKWLKEAKRWEDKYSEWSGCLKFFQGLKSEVQKMFSMQNELFSPSQKNKKSMENIKICKNKLDEVSRDINNAYKKIEQIEFMISGLPSDLKESCKDNILSALYFANNLARKIQKLS